MQFSDGIASLIKLFKDATKVEIGSIAGRVNVIGMFLLTLLILAAAAQGFVNSVVKLIRPTTKTDETSLLSVLIVFTVAMVLCLGVVTVDDHLRNRRS